MNKEQKFVKKIKKRVTDVLGYEYPILTSQEKKWKSILNLGEGIYTNYNVKTGVTTKVNNTLRLKEVPKTFLRKYEQEREWVQLFNFHYNTSNH